MCAGGTLTAVATAKVSAVRDGEVKAEGDLDVRGIPGVDHTASASLRASRLTFALGTDADDARLLHLTECYCVVLQTNAAPVRFRAQLRPVSRGQISDTASQLPDSDERATASRTSLTCQAARKSGDAGLPVAMASRKRRHSMIF